MSSSDGFTWVTTVKLPAIGKAAYKYVIMENNAALQRSTSAALESASTSAGDNSSANGNSEEDGGRSGAGEALRLTPVAAEGSDGAGSGAASRPKASSSEQAPRVLRWETLEGGRPLTVTSDSLNVDDGSFNEMPAPDAGRVTVGLSAHAQSRTASGAGEIEAGDDSRPTVIIVLYRLPIIAKRVADGSWSFKWDDDALYLTSVGLREGLRDKMRLVWVGIINSEDEVQPHEMDAVSQTLLADFSCVPVFIPRETLIEFYQGFCKGTLWPLFHMLTPLTDENDHTVQFDRSLWHTYCLVNRKFSDVVVALYQEDNMIWIHDYHLMVLPSQLRRRLSGSKIGFFLHIPWPSSEAYRTLPVRDELLRGLLSSTLLGFHLFDYARHFLSACVRLLNLEHEARRGILGVEYSGRHVMIRVSHIGIDPARFTGHLGSDAVQEKKEALGLMPVRDHKQHVLAAIDDLDVFKGISLKLLAFENLLQAYTTYRGRVVLVQVAIPKKARVKSHVQSEIRELVEQINSKYGSPDYTPIIYIERDISFDERIAIYSEADALLLTPIRDGLNLIPYEYIASAGQGKGQLILSEFTGCSRALSSAVRLNPWNYDEVMSAIDRVLQKDPEEIMLKHAADRKYVESHPTAKWAESFLTDLTQASEPVQKLLKLGLGLGVGLRVLEFEGFEALNAENVVRAYDAAEASDTQRVFLLDYDGTLTMSTCSSRMSHAWARPSDAAMQYLAALALDPRNHVYIMSGRTKDVLAKTFAGIPAIGLAAEHGFYYRSPNSADWTNLDEVSDLSWREVALEIMTGYAERTDGSYIEEKSAGLVWHYLDADPEFGNWQAKEMRDHLETVLNMFDVQVVTGHGWLQVRLQNMNKGAMTQKILKELIPDGSAPGFVLCVGDDRTDEDMFTFLARELGRHHSALFTCTVGVKPSNANYYLRTSDEVVDLLGLVSMTAGRQSSSAAAGATTSTSLARPSPRSTTVSDFRELARSGLQ
eukprot:CAMPEP_0185849246 /NCGR_PEP_ID=MMETSP1354-20130828/3803_1 /TAXON_ID=708628 /ORGANISM="Erythrolobus madagascarensis, Strain CCMP3276" /LENGTH=987 /DNA_ID=CAMNT_0028549735 /DNA_START=124 /DNA_END=3087 /DNA_ORIENTATION=-